MTPFTIGSGGDIQSWASFPVATDSALVFGFVGRASGGEPVAQDLKQIIERAPASVKLSQVDQCGSSLNQFAS